MRNLNYLDTVEIDEFNLIKNSKQNVTRNRLNGIQNLVVTNYDLYLNSFNTIHEIGASTFSVESSNDLRSCYTSKTIARDRLLARIVNSQTTHFKYICPYCLLIPRTTIDHYIPEGTYPVYSVLARNLIPCCTTCNEKKLEYWREGGMRAIIHYYSDMVPQTQFLFGTLAFSVSNVPFIKYNIQQAPGITNNFFGIAEKHFERLDLLMRYEKNLDLVVSDIVDDVESNRLEFDDSLTTQVIANIILNKSNRHKQHYGINYWKSIALDLLANSQQFLDTL